MLMFETAAAIAAAPDHASIDPAVKRLLARRVSDWAAQDYLDLTVLVVAEPGDTLADVGAAMGVRSHAGPNADELAASLDWVQAHTGLYEAMRVAGNDPFAFFLLVPDLPGIDPELLATCRATASGDPHQIERNR